MLEQVRTRQTQNQLLDAFQENLQLRSQITVLQNEINSLRVFLVKCAAPNQPLMNPLAESLDHTNASTDDGEDSNPQVD